MTEKHILQGFAFKDFLKDIFKERQNTQISELPVLSSKWNRKFARHSKQCAKLLEAIA